MAKRLIRKLNKTSLLHIGILVAVLVICLIPISSAETLIQNSQFSISIPEQNEHIRIFGIQSPKLPVIICNLQDKSAEIDLEFIYDALGFDSNIYLYNDTADEYSQFDKLSFYTEPSGFFEKVLDFVGLYNEELIKQKHSKYIFPPNNKKGNGYAYGLLKQRMRVEKIDEFNQTYYENEVPECVELFYEIKMPSIDSSTEYNITIYDGSSPALTLDPAISGCNTNATTIYCNDTTYTGNSIDTNLDILISNAVIDGTGTPGLIRLNSTSGSINIISSTLNGYGLSSSTGQEGKVEIYGNNKDINIISSTINSYGGIATSTNGGHGRFKIISNSNNVSIINSIINNYGGLPNEGIGSRGGNSYFNIINYSYLNINSTINSYGAPSNTIGGNSNGGDIQFNIIGIDSSEIKFNNSYIDIHAGDCRNSDIGCRGGDCIANIKSDDIIFLDGYNILNCSAGKMGGGSSNPGKSYLSFNVTNKLTFNPNVLLIAWNPQENYSFVNFTASKAKFGIFNASIQETMNIWSVYPLLFAQSGTAFKNITWHTSLHNISLSEYPYAPDFYTERQRSNPTDIDVIEGTTHTYYLDIYYDNSVVANISNAKLYYNGTEYSGSYAANDSQYYNFTTSLTIPLLSQLNRSVTYYWNYTANYINGTSVGVSSFEQTQTQHQFRFEKCNVTFTQPFINFTFKDESTGSNINASIDASTWTYYGNGISGNTKSLLFSNIPLNPSYAFCGYPAWGNITVSSASVQYSSSEGATYPQRTYAITDDILTNSTTNQVLYLLSSTSGIYSNYQVLTTGNQVIPGATIIIEREISGVWIIIAQGVTDSAGTVTFWLNPNYEHRYTVSATGYAGQTFTIKPTQTTYTITMGGAANPFLYAGLTEGLIWSAFPPSGILQPGVYNFTLAVNTSKNNLQNCSMVLALPNGTILGEVSGCSSGWGIIKILNFNTTDYPLFYGSYYVTINNTLITLDSDGRWYGITINASGNTFSSLKAGLQALNNLSEFGTDVNKAEFSKIVFFFLFFAIILAVLNFYTGYDSAYPGAIILIMVAVGFILSIINGPGGPGYLYLANAVNPQTFGNFAPVINNWIIELHFVMLGIIYYFTTTRRYQT